jgi:hypothetical protein
MIQRIQTLYLLAAEVLTAILFFSNFAKFLDSSGADMVLTYKGLYQVGGDQLVKLVNAWPMAALLVVASLVGFVVIFFYRRRMFQIRLCFLAMVLQLGFLVMMAYYIYSIATVGKGAMSLTVVDIFPLVSIVLYYLAYRGIAKDEAMVIASSFRTRR